MLDTTDVSYKIGAVARITGIPPETLRAWERRYNAVIPQRANSGDRKYSRDDVAKLLLLKSCIDSGISISTVANLHLHDLKEFIQVNDSKSHPRRNGYSSENNDKRIISRVALLGECFPIRVIDGLDEVRDIELLGEFENLPSLQAKITKNTQPDVVIVEKPTINKQTKAYLQEIQHITGAWHIILIYGFSNQAMVEELQSSQVTVVRSSIDAQELARLCIYHSGGSEGLPVLVHDSTIHFEQTIPTRIFSNNHLRQLAGVSNTIKCECPQHISDLVRDLVAFETYSAECENENTEDAALHAYLHATTAQARSMLEEALSHLIRIEGIELT